MASRNSLIALLESLSVNPAETLWCVQGCDATQSTRWGELFPWYCQLRLCSPSACDLEGRPTFKDFPYIDTELCDLIPHLLWCCCFKVTFSITGCFVGCDVDLQCGFSFVLKYSYVLLFVCLFFAQSIRATPVYKRARQTHHSGDGEGGGHSLSGTGWDLFLLESHTFAGLFDKDF